MTTARPQSQVGPIVTAPLTDGFTHVKVYDERALNALKLKPVPTVWGREEGKPVYDRLPAISQAYKLDYFGEEDSGYVYIDPRLARANGPGSLEVGAWEGDQGILVIQSGTVTWAKGQIPIDGLAVNIAELNSGEGLQDGVYQVGYYLSYEQEVAGGSQLYLVTTSSLSNSLALYTASSAVEEYPFEAAFTDAEDESWRPTESGYSGPYDKGSYLLIDFTEAVTADGFILTPTNGIVITATCTLYRSNDGITWEKDSEVKPVDGTWSLSVESDLAWRYWKLYFWDGIVDVRTVSYSGEAPFINQRPTGPVSSATPFLEESDAQIVGPSVILALVTVKRKKIESVSDLRRITSQKYEPVAKWLTDFQDGSLREYIFEVSNYAEKFLAPPTSLDPFYAELLDDRTFTLGPEVSSPTISLPTEIELREYSNGYQASVTPTQAILLSSPVEDSDLSTMEYVNLTFIVSLDNGIY